MRRLLSVVVAACLLCAFTGGAYSAQTTLAITQVWQHKDTPMGCALSSVPGLPANKAHSWNCATANTCPYCAAYCAPAAASMIGTYMGQAAPFVDIDNIYDNAKVVGEIMGNGILETRGVGMYAGVGSTPPEVQNAFTYAAGIVPFQHGPLGTPNPLITYEIIRWYIDNNHPVLWVDIGSWPADQGVLPGEMLTDSGHCKVIAGYDDLDTADLSDDLLLIFDPWPTSGSSYWLAHGQVVDANDVFLSTTQAFANEEATWGQIKNMFD